MVDVDGGDGDTGLESGRRCCGLQGARGVVVNVHGSDGESGVEDR